MKLFKTHPLSKKRELNTQAARERDDWIDTARHYGKDADFWRNRCQDRCRRDGHAWIETGDLASLYCTCCGSMRPLTHEAEYELDKEQPLVERLACIEHERWSDWQRYLHDRATKNPDGSLTIPARLVERWERQINTPYWDLSEQEKESDREQVLRYLNLVRE